jgi:hypothetical protein
VTAQSDGPGGKRSDKAAQLVSSQNERVTLKAAQ